MPAKELTGPDNLPFDVLEQIISPLSTDKATLASASLVMRKWREPFQDELIATITVPEPSKQKSKLQQLVVDEQLADVRNHLLSTISTIHFGTPYNPFDESLSMTNFGRMLVDRCHLPILFQASKLTSLNFSFVTFSWFEFGVEDFDCFHEILCLPNMREISFLACSGCYIPLSLFFRTTSHNIKVLKLEDVSFEPIIGYSDPDALRELVEYKSPSARHLRPGRLDNLKLKGLGMVANFLDFILTNAVEWPSRGQLVELDLDCKDTYMSQLDKPNAFVVVGQLLEKVGFAIEKLKVHLECDPTGILGQGNVKDLNALVKGLQELLELKKLSFCLTVHAPLTTEADTIAGFACGWLAKALRALPFGMKLTHFQLGCQASLSAEDNQLPLTKDVLRYYSNTLLYNSVNELNDFFCLFSDSLLQKCTAKVNLYHKSTREKITYRIPTEPQIAANYPEFHDIWLGSRRVTVSAAVCWDPFLGI